MKIVEFRLAMPLTLEEYKLCQLYLVAKASLEDSEKNMSNFVDKNESISKKGIVILKNESYCNENGTTGQYTYKRINFLNKLPRWLLNFVDSKYCIIDEQSWNSYPYLKTVYESSGFPKAKIQVESAHHVGFNTEENALNLSPNLLALRKVIFIDIVNDKLSNKDYIASEDPSLFYSEKAKRGRLAKSWKEESEHIMTCYKVFTISIPYFGIFGSKIENWIISSLKDNILKYHRKAFCWMDEWYGLTIEDIRNIEKEVQKKLNDFWKQVEGGTECEAEEEEEEEEKEKKERNQTKQEECVLKNLKGRTKLSNEADSTENEENTDNDKDIESEAIDVNLEGESENEGLCLEEKESAFLGMKKEEKKIRKKLREEREVERKVEEQRQVSEKYSNKTDSDVDANIVSASIPVSVADSDSETETVTVTIKGTEKETEKRIFSGKISKEITMETHVNNTVIGKRRSQNHVKCETISDSREENSGSCFIENVVDVSKDSAEANSFFFFQKRGSDRQDGEYGEYLYRLNEGMFHSWKYRYVIIQDNKLLCYLDDKKSVFKGEIDILNAQIQWIGEYKGRNSVFVIHSRSKNVAYFSAETDFDTKRCMLDVQMATLLKKKPKEESTKIEEPIRGHTLNGRDHRDQVSVEKRNVSNSNVSNRNNYCVREDEDTNNQNSRSSRNKEYISDFGFEEKKGIRENKERSGHVVEIRETQKTKRKSTIEIETSIQKEKEQKHFAPVENKQTSYLHDNKKGSIDTYSNKMFVERHLERRKRSSKHNEHVLNYTDKERLEKIEKSFNFQNEQGKTWKQSSGITKEKKREIDSTFVNKRKEKENRPLNASMVDHTMYKGKVEIKGEGEEYDINVETISLRLKDDISSNLLHLLHNNTERWSTHTLQELSKGLKKLEFERMGKRNKTNLLCNLFHVFSALSCIYSLICLYLYLKIVLYCFAFCILCVYVCFDEEKNRNRSFNKVYKCATHVPVSINQLMMFLMSDKKYFKEVSKETFTTKSGNIFYVSSSFKVDFQKIYLYAISFLFKKRNAYSSLRFYKVTKEKEGGNDKGEKIKEELENREDKNRTHTEELCYVVVQQTDRKAKQYFRLITKYDKMEKEKISWQKVENRSASPLDFGASNEKKIIKCFENMHMEEESKSTQEEMEEKEEKEEKTEKEKEKEQKMDIEIKDPFKSSTTARSQTADVDTKNNMLFDSPRRANVSNNTPSGITLDRIIQELKEGKGTDIYENFQEMTKMVNTSWMYFFFWKWKLCWKFLKKLFFKEYVNINGFDIFVIKEKGPNLCEVTFFTSYNYGSFFFNKMLNKSRCATIHALSLLVKDCDLFSAENVETKERKHTEWERGEASAEKKKDSLGTLKRNSDKQILTLLEKKRIEKNICAELLCNGLKKEFSGNLIIHVYNIMYTEYLKNENLINLINNVDESFFIINFTKTFLYIMENIRAHDIKQLKMNGEYLKNAQRNLDYVDNLFVSNVIVLLKSLKLFFFAFENSFVFPKKNETFQCFFGNSKISTHMKNDNPLVFSITAHNLQLKGKMICDFVLTPVWDFNGMKILIENTVHIKTKSNYQINFRCPNIALNKLLQGELTFSLFGELIVMDSLNSSADVQFSDQADSNGQIFGVIKRKNTVTDVLTGSIFETIVLNDEKIFNMSEKIKMNIIPSEESINSMT